MKPVLFTAVYFILFSSLAVASGGEYAVSKIDTALLKKANAVKRFEQIEFNVIELNKARYYHTYVITILNDKADHFANLTEHYDRLQSVVSIEGILYNALGEKIKSLKKSDLQDRSASGDNNLADDDRLKFHNFYCKTYPYTIRYEVELKLNYTMFYPGWIPVDDEHLAVEYSAMIVSMPEGIDFRYKAMCNAPAPVISTEKTNRNYKWELKNFLAVEEEYKSPSWYEMVPTVLMGPVQFQIEDYKGNMATWQDYGKFVYALKEGRDVLPDNIKATVHALTDGLKKTTDKIDALYKLMQQNSRYISVQLGIGGWQPFDAGYVAQKKYGDCKALSNYMYALLKEAGIKSFYTLVKSRPGNKFFMPDFPCSQFNHVILSVPLDNDTMWLECTSQTIAAGYLSDHTDDRYVLLVDESGGRLVRTPRYDVNENLQVRKIKVLIDENGKGLVSVAAMYRALQQDDLQHMINGLSSEKVKEYLNEKFSLASYELLSYDYKEKKSALPVVEENLEISANNYADVSGKRLFIVPNVLTRSSRKPAPDDNRKYDVAEYLGYRDIDSVEIKIPAGYKLESLPKDVALTTPFGKYTATIKITENNITYQRLMEQYSGRFAAAEYNKLVKFYEQIYKADRAKIVFVKAL